MSPTATEELCAYHGDQALKKKTVAKARWHRKHSILDRHTYFKKNGDTRVCAVGCLTEDPEGGHHLYPEKWGIPEWLAYLEEKVFVGLPDGKMEDWPVRFLEAIPVGADFDGLADRLAIRRLKEECLPLSGEWPESVRSKVVAAIEQTIAALESGKEEDKSAARSAARSAAESAAWSAARSAAWSAAYEREADRLIAELEALPVRDAVPA